MSKGFSAIENKRLTVVDHQLRIGGKSLDDIANMLGQDVFYAYDFKVVEEQVATIRQALPASVSLSYAVKANPLPALVSGLSRLVDGFDVASHKEMLLALESGIRPCAVSFAGPAKQAFEIRAAIAAGVTLNIESSAEFELALCIAEELNTLANIAFRVNPAFQIRGNGMQMGGGAKPFGIDEEYLTTWLPGIDFSQFNFCGFHIFWGSQNLDPQAICEAHQHLFALARHLCQVTPVDIPQFNLGGGFGVPYFSGQVPLDLKVVGDNLASLIAAYPEVNKATLKFELGRFLVAEAGVYACKIIDIKQSRDTKFLMVNGGMHHHLANSGNFGQVFRKNYPVALAEKFGLNQHLEKVSIAGPLCTPLDVVASAVELPAPEVGDWLVVLQSGAYGASASPQQFLSQQTVAEVLLRH